MRRTAYHTGVLGAAALGIMALWILAHLQHSDPSLPAILAVCLLNAVWVSEFRRVWAHATGHRMPERGPAYILWVTLGHLALSVPALFLAVLIALGASGPRLSDGMTLLITLGIGLFFLLPYLIVELMMAPKPAKGKVPAQLAVAAMQPKKKRRK